MMQKIISESYNRAFSYLKKLGYQPLPSVQSMAARGGSNAHPLLEKILKQQLSKLNHYRYGDQQYNFSHYNIEHAFSKIKYALASDYNQMYRLLRYGLQTREAIESEIKIFTIRYIDWENIENNQFHLVKDYETFFGPQKVRLDMVLFVNGIPLVLLDFSLLGSLATFNKLELLTNEQVTNTSISFAQLLLSISPERVEYNTTNANEKMWPVWTEDEDTDELRQDIILNHLCAPENLLHLIKNYILAGGKDNKRIAWSHQIRAVENTIERIRTYHPDGSRRGGIISHAPGSGITSTMMLLMQSIMQQKDIPRPRILLVTDAIAIDKQIQQTFSKYGLFPAVQATSGKHLMELLESDNLIITTVINKFYNIPLHDAHRNNTSELFILIDDIHRGYSGAFFKKLQMLFPKACYIGFTRMPFLGNKDTFKDNELIDLHSIEDAVKNEVMVPVSYWGRRNINQAFSYNEMPIIPEHTGPWKRLRKSFDYLNVDIIAKDITEYFLTVNKGTTFKAILVAPSRLIAKRYKEYFDRQSDYQKYINTAVIISKEDINIRHDDGHLEYDDKYSFSETTTEEENIEEIIQKLKSPSNELEILIICNHQLKGFDTSYVNTLFITKYLQGNALQQRIALINRPSKNKFESHVVDYIDIQKEFNHSINAWQQLSPIENGERAPVTEKHKFLRLKNSINTLDWLRELIEKSVTCNTIPSHFQLSQGELAILFLDKLHECKSILPTIEFESKELKNAIEAQIEELNERLEIHEQFAEEAEKYLDHAYINTPFSPTEFEDHPTVSDILQNDRLAISFFRIFKTMLKKKGAKVSDEKLATFSSLSAGKITAMAVRDWQMSSKVCRDMTNYLEDALVFFDSKYKISIDFNEIDELLSGFLNVSKDILTK